MTPSPLLVCLFCHADDEFPVFAELEAAVAAGHRIICIYLTDGAFYGGQSAERRERESRAVLGRIGVPQVDVHFPGGSVPIGDTKLYLYVAEAVNICRALLPMTTPHQWRLLIPAWEGGHHDHDAAHIVGLVLAQERPGCEVLQASLYHGKGLPGVLFRVLSPLRENGPVLATRIAWRARLRYLRYCLSYPSQWKTWAGLFPLVLLNYLLVGRQRLQRVSPGRVLERPHQGPMLYERRGFCTWGEFAMATAAARTWLTRRVPR